MVSGVEGRGRHGARCLFHGVRNRLGFLERKFRGMHTARQVWNGIDPEENFTAEASQWIIYIHCEYGKLYLTQVIYLVGEKKIISLIRNIFEFISNLCKIFFGTKCACRNKQRRKLLLKIKYNAL